MSQSNAQVERVILQYETRYSDALADIERLDDANETLEARIDRLSRASIDIDAELNVTGSSVLTDLEALDSVTYTPAIDPDLQRSELNDLEALDSAELTPVVDPDVQSDTELTNLEALDSATLTPEVDAQATANTTDLLEQIRNLQVLDIALNVTGQGAALLQNVVNLLGESEAAAARLTAQIGGELPDAQERINRLLLVTSASREDIARRLAQGVQLGIDPAELDTAVQRSLALGDALELGSDELLASADKLVTQGLAPNLEAAFDVITAGYQEGVNRGGDFLDVLTENASTFRDLGLNAEQATALLNDGLDAGFANAGQVADALKEFNIRANDLGDTAAQDALTTLGLPTPEEAQAELNMTGQQYLQAVLDGLSNVENVGQRETLTKALFGTQAEDFSVETLLSLDPATAFFDTIEGRAQTAADTFQNTLGNTVQNFFDGLQVGAETALSSEQLGLEEKLTDLKNRLNGALADIAGGMSLTEAIEVNFNLPGFAQDVDRIESMFGNFLIGLLEIVARVQEFSGNDASGTRSEITRLAQGQLAFDLQAVPAEEITGVIRTAIERGVSEADVTTALNTAVSEQLAAGNIEQAQALANQGGQSRAVLSTSSAFGLVQQQAEFVQGATESLADFEARVQAARDALASNPLITSVEVEALPAIDTTEAQAAINATVTQLETDLQAAVDEGRLGDALDIAEQLNNPDAIGAITAAIDDQIQAANDAIAAGDLEAARTIAENIGSDELLAQIESIATTATDTAESVGTAAGDMATSFEDADESITDSISGNSIVPDIESILAAAENSLPAAGRFADLFADDLQELSAVGGSAMRRLRGDIDLTAAAVASLIAGMSAIPSSVTGTVNNNSVVINQTNHNNSAASAAASSGDVDNYFRGNPQ